MNNLIDSLVPDNIKTLKTYKPGKPIEALIKEHGIKKAIKVASNENPLGPSPLALEAAARELEKLHVYPDGDSHDLKEVLSAHVGVSTDELIFGAGSDELIDLIVRTFCKPGQDQILTHKYAFISYKLSAQAHNVEFIETAVDEAYQVDLDALLEAITSKTRVIFLANPNNPTGQHIRRPDLERFLLRLPREVILVMDEAYYEYAIDSEGKEYPNSLTYRHEASHPLLITLRTFSKIYGLAGLRVGYAMADCAIVDYMNRVRRPFNINRVAQAAAAASLQDSAHVEQSRVIAHQGTRTMVELMTNLGLRAYPSLTNFTLVDMGKPVDSIYRQLLNLGIVVRPLGPWGLPDHLRISVGTSEEIDSVITTLSKVLES